MENQLVYEILIFSVTLCYDILVRLYHLHGVLRIRMLLYIKHIFETRILSTQARIKLNLLELISHMSFLCTFNPWKIHRAQPVELIFHISFFVHYQSKKDSSSSTCGADFSYYFFVMTPCKNRRWHPPLISSPTLTNMYVSLA